jgi:hypothetical protein
MGEAVMAENGTKWPNIFSALLNRGALASRLGHLFGGDRKVHEVLGYKPMLEYRDFKARYLRQDLAHRIVTAYPDATWAQFPTIKEDDQEDILTPFEAAWEALAKQLNLHTMLKRVDVLANIGQYSILVIGLRGQSDLASPATPVRSPDDVLYVTPYSEEWATIERLEGNGESPMFGKPLLYRINFGRNTQTRGQASLPVGTAMVHASRVIHIAEDTLDDDIYGVPRLEPIYDRLDDLLKVVGGSAEMFWRDAKRRIALELREGYKLPPAEEDTLTDEVQEYMHDLKDFIRVEGVDVKNLSGVIADPEKHFAMLIDILSGVTGIPKRILTGSERGELSSVQDSASWLERVTQRQQQFAEPVMLRRLIDRLILLRALPTPAQPYSVDWGNLFALSEKDRAAVAQNYASAISQYAGQGMASLVVPPQEFREVYLGLPAIPDVAEEELSNNGGDMGESDEGM